MLGREETGVVVAVQGLLPVGDEGSTLKKKESQFLSTTVLPLGNSHLIDVCSRVRSKLTQLVRSLTHV